MQKKKFRFQGIFIQQIQLHSSNKKFSYKLCNKLTLFFSQKYFFFSTQKHVFEERSRINVGKNLQFLLSLGFWCF